MCVALPPPVESSMEISRRPIFAIFTSNQGRWMYVAHQQKCGMWTLSICSVSPWIASHSSFGKRFLLYQFQKLLGGTTCMCCFNRKTDCFSVSWILKPHPTYIWSNNLMIDKTRWWQLNHSLFSVKIPGEFWSNLTVAYCFHGSKGPTDWVLTLVSGEYPRGMKIIFILHETHKKIN